MPWTPSAVAAVGRQRDIDHRIVEAQRFGGGHADLGVRRQFDDAVMIVGRQSSRSEHSMPRDSTPRMAPTFKHIAGRRNDRAGRANTPFMPVRALGAPQTTCTMSAPVSTMQSLQLVGIGMLLGARPHGRR